MNPIEARKIFLKIFIGFLSLTALVAIFCVFVGNFGEFELKVLATTFAISAASICSMSCAAFIEIRKKKELGYLGITFSGIAALLAIFGLWTEIDREVYWKITFTFIVLSISLAQMTYSLNRKI